MLIVIPRWFPLLKIDLIALGISMVFHIFFVWLSDLKIGTNVYFWLKIIDNFSIYLGLS